MADLDLVRVASGAKLAITTQSSSKVYRTKPDGAPTTLPSADEPGRDLSLGEYKGIMDILKRVMTKCAELQNEASVAFSGIEGSLYSSRRKTTRTSPKRHFTQEATYWPEG